MLLAYCVSRIAQAERRSTRADLSSVSADSRLSIKELEFSIKQHVKRYDRYLDLGV